MPKNRKNKTTGVDWRIEVLATGYEKSLHRKNSHESWFDTLLFLQAIGSRTRDPEIDALYRKHVRKIERIARDAEFEKSFYLESISGS